MNDRDPSTRLPVALSKEVRASGRRSIRLPFEGSAERARRHQDAPNLLERPDLVRMLLGGSDRLLGVRPAIRLLRQILSEIDAAARIPPRKLEARNQRRPNAMELNRVIATLPPRQRQVLEGLKEGLTEKEIASRLQISGNTVHVYIKALYRRFDVGSRSQLLSLWLKSNDAGDQ